MELYAVLAVLVAIVTVYLFRQFWSHALEIDDLPSNEPAIADADATDRLQAA